jgi:hypothetical protein
MSESCGNCGRSVLDAYDRQPSDVQPWRDGRMQGEGASTSWSPRSTTYIPDDGEPALKDSGQREHFPSGMVRDIRTGKGRYDLISPYAKRRLAKIMEKGCAKYGERNWEQGAPADRFLDSCLRHLAQWQMGMTDEDHLGQAFWNLHCIVHFDEIEYGQTPDAENLTSSKGWHE